MKLHDFVIEIETHVVTTCVVVWIEITQLQVVATGDMSHHLRGGVD